jgi:hypothetical protein
VISIISDQKEKWPLRESFLVVFRSEIAADLRRVAQKFWGVAQELPWLERSRVPLRSRLRAALADLRDLERALSSLSADREDGSDQRLAALAAEKAAELRRIAGDLERHLKDRG